ncbi:MAG: NAD-dependent epimerase/dehydratase family protein [Desulfobulbaceae bacterium]|nr:NAD-dependent epimerase/dehydratase family protein [Desulfobulbaceae bacterium]
MIDTLCRIPAGTPVLVTGATGFTGIVLTRKLVEAGLKVSAVARKSSNLSPLSDLNITWFRGDVFDEEVMRQAVEGQEYVFHVAAAFREAKSTEQDYWDVHVRSTQIICEEVLKNPEFKRYVHVSTIGVHGHIDNPPATEEYRFSPGDGYQRTKLQAEEWLNDFATDNRLPYTIIRPAAIYGPGDQRLLKLFKMALKPFFLLLGNGKCMYHLVHVDDLTNTFIIAATHPDALGETFISGANEPIAIADIARIVAEHFNRKMRVVRLPIGPFFLAADICEAICRPLRIEPPIYRRRVAFYSKDRHFDISKMRNILGYEPRHGNKEGITETADWYVEQGWLRP